MIVCCISGSVVVKFAILADANAGENGTFACEKTHKLPRAPALSELCISMRAAVALRLAGSVR